jgi:hypothetical protein
MAYYARNLFRNFDDVCHNLRPNAALFFGPLADIVRVETILLLSGAMLVLVGVIYGLSEKKAGLQEST